MTIYHTFLDDSGAGAETILGIQQDGSEYGVGISADIVCQNLNVSGINTLGVTTTTNLTAQQLNVSGIVTATSFIGDGSGLTNVSVSGVNTSGTSAFINLTAQQLNISGISTLQTTTIIGGGTSTGTASQPLQVTGGAYVSGSVGIGTTNPTQKLDVVGNGNFTGIVTASSFIGNGSQLTNIEPNITSCLFT